MKKRVEKAIENHEKGCNCAQAVAVAYTDILGVDEKTVYKMMEAFGSGVGGEREICGACTGGILALSSANSNGELYNKETRQDTYDRTREYLKAFREVDGTYQCGELLQLRSEGKSGFPDCTACVQKAAELVEQFLKEE